MKIASISIADYSEATEGMPHDVERLYFRMLLKMFSREGGLPDSDAENAFMFGYDIRIYKRLKAKLLARPDAVYVEGGELKNARVEKELAQYRVRKDEAVENGRLGGKISGKSRRDRVKIDPEVEPTLPGLPPDFATTSPELRPNLPQKSLPISYATVGENNDLAEPSPSPSPNKGVSTHSTTPVEQAAAREGVEQSRSEKVKGPSGLTPSADALERGYQAAKGWDRQFLLSEFREFNEGKELGSVDKAWVGFCRKRGPNPDHQERSFTSSVSPEILERDAKERAAKIASGETETITPRHALWVYWMDHLRARGERELADRIDAAGAMAAPMTGPVRGCSLPWPLTPAKTLEAAE